MAHAVRFEVPLICCEITPGAGEIDLTLTAVRSLRSLEMF